MEKEISFSLPERWEMKSPPQVADSDTQKLVDQFSISPIFAKLLIARGFQNSDEVKKLLFTDLKSLPDPNTILGMERGVNLILKAIQSEQKIAVWGDYDVDGCTGSALLYWFFKECGIEITNRQPSRFVEGYGIHPDGLQSLKDEGCDLVISVDCGITSIEAAKKAKEIGLTLVVTDHHKPKSDLPDADVIINPNQVDDESGLGMLAGVGVAFFLCIALRKKMRDEGFFEKIKEPNLKKHLDLVAMGTVADMAPLVSVNRVLVREGLKALAFSKKPGIQALIKASGANKNSKNSLSTFDIGFLLGPRINAAGRIGSPEKALNLLKAESSEEAEELANNLNQMNQKRVGLQADLWQDVQNQVTNLGDLSNFKGLILHSNDWHEGVIGIIASKVTQEYGLPAVVICFDSDTGLGKGSARSVGKINLFNIISECSESLEEFGGHAFAAGLTIREDKIDEFKDQFQKVLSKNTHPSDYSSKLECDLSIQLEDLNPQVVTEIESLGPFGVANPEPLFVAEGISQNSLLLKGRHLKLKVGESKRSTVEAIGFNMSQKELPQEGSKLQMVFTPEINTWGGRRSLQLRLKDLEV